MKKVVLSLIFVFVVINFCHAQEAKFIKQIEIPSLDSRLPNLQLDAPEGWRCTLGTDMEDFKVYYLKNAVSTAQIGIYMGFQPNLFSKRLKSIKVAEKAGVIGDMKISWYMWEENKNGQKIYHRETILSGLYSKTKSAEKNLKEHLLLHIFVAAEKKLDLEEAANIVQTLRLKK